MTIFQHICTSPGMFADAGSTFGTSGIVWKWYARNN
jgi:hypothetical protein